MPLFVFTQADDNIAPVCTPTLQVIGLQTP